MTAKPTHARRRGEGSLRLRADGRYEIRYRDLHGIHRSAYFDDEELARRALTKAIRERDQGIPHAASRMTVAQWLPIWLEGKRNLRPRSKVGYAKLLDHWLVGPIAKRRLAELLPEHVNAGLSAMSRRGLSTSTQAQATSILRMALKAAVQSGHCGRNVVTLIDPPRAEPVPVRPPKGADLEALRAQIARHHLEALWLLALRTGLRQGEILALEWRDVDWAEHTLSVTKTLEHGTQRVGPPKSRAGYRGGPIPIHDDVLEALRRHEARLRASGIRPHPSRPIFTSRGGRYYLARNILRSWHELCDRAGVRHYRMHDLRHAAVTELLRHNNLQLVSRYVGHSSVRITADLYGHLDLGDIRLVNAAENMDGQ